ncbi:MAG: hypothetical protein OXN94_13460 [Chloroflexota bacterium]|nr:hypothetical protein [Chloroflexota bacterium]
MNDKDPQQNGIPVQSPVSKELVPDNAGSPPESHNPRPEPSYGEITEGESEASLWQTLKIALSK